MTSQDTETGAKDAGRRNACKLDAMPGCNKNECMQLRCNFCYHMDCSRLDERCTDAHSLNTSNMVATRLDAGRLDAKGMDVCGLVTKNRIQVE